MEALVDNEFKCFDDTSALIYSSVSSSLPPAGLQLKVEPSLKKLIKREVTSPAREYVKEHEEESLSGLLNEQCEVDNKKWFVRTEAASPPSDTVEIDQTPALPNEQSEVDNKVQFIKTEAASPERDSSNIDWNPGLHLEREPSLKKSIKEEVTSPQHLKESPPEGSIEQSLKMFIKTKVTLPQHVGEHEVESSPGPADKQRTGSDQCFPCPYCPHMTQLESDLEIHVNSTHKNRKMLQREYITRSKSDIKLHTDSNNKKVNVFQCPHCECSTSCNFDLKAHLLFVHTKRNLKRRCPICTSSKHCLKQHIDSVHKKIKPFQCAHCSYNSSSKTSLKLHIDLRHNNLRPFHCPHCTSKFPSKGRLQLHIDSVHKKIKAFECPHCNYKTNYKGGLEHHIDRIHSKRRRFVCPFCDYKVLRLRTLKIHIHQSHKD